MILDTLTEPQKATISYHSTIISLMKKEYEKARKEVHEHEHSRQSIKSSKERIRLL